MDSKEKGAILIVDDEVDACDFIKSFLEDREYTVFTALNGRTGIDLIKNKKPALIFLDVRMPDMSGIEVLSELKKDGISAKIILMTGLEEGEEIDKARTLGIIDVLKKPVQLPVLSEIIKNNL
jgi:DNA-binding response OmpR family regulator